LAFHACQSTNFIYITLGLSV